MADLGKNIKKIRRKWNMDQVEFGNFMGVSKGAISMYETGNNEPKIPFLVRLCKLTNIDIQTMYEEEVLDKDIPEKPLENGKRDGVKESKIKYEDLNMGQELMKFPVLVATVRSLLERVGKLEEE